MEIKDIIELIEYDLYKFKEVDEIHNKKIRLKDEIKLEKSIIKNKEFDKINSKIEDINQKSLDFINDFKNIQELKFNDNKKVLTQKIEANFDKWLDSLYKECIKDE